MGGRRRVNVGTQIKAILANLKKELEWLYSERLATMVLFGSQARGEAEPGSDIDVLVVLKGGVYPGKEIDRTGDIVASISLENDVVVSCVFVSATRYRREKSPLLINVRREGVAL
jgi:uncharacterized protein